jgi:hypothetical protein
MITMVLGLFHRQKPAPPADVSDAIPEAEIWMPSASDPQTIVFDGLTPDRRIIGEIVFAGRLSDALNAREPLPINNVRIAPLGESSFAPDPICESIDPYEFQLVVLGSDSLPRFNAEQQMAHRVRKASHLVEIDLAPYQVVGVIWLDIGTTIESLSGRNTKLYLPVTEALVMLGNQVVDLRGSDAVLINLFSLRKIRELPE